jgi:hypothetical protein
MPQKRQDTKQSTKREKPAKGIVPNRTPKKAAFLAAFAEAGTVKHAAEIAGVSPKHPYYWLQNDSKFAAAFEQAKEDAIQSLEWEARRRAIEGRSEPVFYKGKRCAVIRKPSDTLLIFLLKAARPEIYRDNYSPNPGATAESFAGMGKNSQLPTREELIAETRELLAQFEAESAHELNGRQIGRDKP